MHTDCWTVKRVVFCCIILVTITLDHSIHVLYHARIFTIRVWYDFAYHMHMIQFCHTIHVLGSLCIAKATLQKYIVKLLSSLHLSITVGVLQCVWQMILTPAFGMHATSYVQHAHAHLSSQIRHCQITNYTIMITKTHHGYSTKSLKTLEYNCILLVNILKSLSF